MPELPEVETAKRYFNRTSLNREIENIEVKTPQILNGTTEKELRKAIQGRKFSEGKRHGKYLLAGLNNGPWLVLHFGMSGDLKFVKPDEEKPPYTKMLIYFSDCSHLAYTSIRKFGNIALTPTLQEFIERKSLGPDALNLDFETFDEIISNRRGTIKYTLMNQKIIAGLGNLYTDEILFQTRIHPRAKSNELDKETRRKLFSNLETVLKKATKEKSNFEKLPHSYLIDHRKEGGDCPRCGAKLERTKILGRSTYYCPREQKTG